ncbi:hypothetical protein [Devosia submarina]|uniref:hypothetical protein n=1 Tax=Devosia submarina TaxID=1173082 RepID=UPI000D361AFA|nr:hypothetical protein [Devosia submarina]
MTQGPLVSTKMTAADYRRHFPQIESGFNWERFAAERWPIERRVLTNREELLGFYTFFRSSLGRVMPRFLHWLASRQMRMAEVLEKLHRLPTEDRQSINYFLKLWSVSTEPISMDLPTYRFGETEHFIMDGNHRACAIALSGRPFRIELYSIAGPREPDALVDLASCK